MKKINWNYREGYAALELDAGFFRPDSVLARDISVLIASMQFHEKKKNESLRWLDLMAGCGIRSLRWGLEALGSKSDVKSSLNELEIWVNDADSDRSNLIYRNLQPLSKKRIAVVFKNALAENFLAKRYIEKCFFDLVDLDCFGCPNSLIQPVIRALSFDGILMLSSTDGRSTTGHDRLSAIRTLSASVRTHPANWEIALRLQLAAVASQAWLLGRGIEPLVSFSDGRTFRIVVRIKKRLIPEEEKQIGFIARCAICGSQALQTLLQLRDWEQGCCDKALGRCSWAISGPLWVGNLQSTHVLAQLKKLSSDIPVPIVNRSKDLIDRLHADKGLPVFSWSSHELASRVSLDSMPSLDLIIQVLLDNGYEAVRNGIVHGHFRTNASMDQILRIYQEKFCKGFK